MLPFRLSAVSRVEFCKRDELTTDLICCDVTVGDAVHFRQEEAPDWDQFLRELQELSGFDCDWCANVFEPAFAECRTIAFQRL
jgi:hypothetical protein